VKITETACPFCGGALADLAVPSRLAPAARLGRAAVFAFGVVAAQGCGDDTGSRGRVDAAVNSPADATPDATPDASLDDGGNLPIYAAAPTPDAGPKRG
jgi:hypothetical protein